MTTYLVIGFSGGRHWMRFYSCATKMLFLCFYRLCFRDFCRALTNLLAHICFYWKRRALGFGIILKIFFLYWSRELTFFRKTVPHPLSEAHLATLNRRFKIVTWYTIPDTFPDGKKDFLQPTIALIPHRYSKNCWIKMISKPMQANNLLFSNLVS